MTFSDLMEEIRRLPFDERLTLREILSKDLVAARREQIHQNHLETLEELKSGNLFFSSDVDELMRQLNDE